MAWRLGPPFVIPPNEQEPEGARRRKPAQPSVTSPQREADKRSEGTYSGPVPRASTQAKRRGRRVAIRRKHGQEDCRLHQAANPGWQGEPVASGWSRAGSAWSEHHGILQGVQRPDAEL